MSENNSHICKTLKLANEFTCKPELRPLKIEKTSLKELQDAGFFWELEVHADEFPAWIPIRYCPFCGGSLPVVVKLPEPCHPPEYWENLGEYSKCKVCGEIDINYIK